MDIQMLQMLQLLFVLALLFISFYWIMPVIKPKADLALYLAYPDIVPAYLHFETFLDRSDTHVYDKYQIWRYVLKEKTDSIDSSN